MALPALSDSAEWSHQLAQAIARSKETYKHEEESRLAALKRQKERETKMRLSRRIAKSLYANKHSLIMKCQVSREKIEPILHWIDPRIYRGPSDSMRSIGNGFRNQGNSCFLNATLQCLAYTPAFSQMAVKGIHRHVCPIFKTNSALAESSRSIKSKKSAWKFCVGCEFERSMEMALIHRINPGTNGFVKPINMFRYLSSINECLSPGCQEDACEYLQSLLTKLEESFDADIERMKGFLKEKKPVGFEIPDRDSASKNDRMFLNPIRLLFGGLVRTATQCGKCRRTSNIDEACNILSISVDDSSSLNESLTIMNHDELMTGKDKYHCTPCDQRVIAKKRVEIAQLPEYLIIHLKRFKFNDSWTKMVKASHWIEFETEMDLGEDRRYELYALIVHSGAQLGYGHFYAILRGFDGKSWWMISDSRVERISLKRVLKEQAYLLFYRRIRASEPGAKVSPPGMAGEQGIFDSNHGLSSKVADVHVNDEYFQGNSCQTTVKGMSHVVPGFVKVPGLMDHDEAEDGLVSVEWPHELIE